ncbi:hypothetical protein LXA43DRAFT_1061173 [Ganoderma leucocontextum]|nr:hypothetical protein LXA43DRAFT_1061173 [Ganoderma leucocontextum]
MSFICRICLDGLENKTAMSTTCGHIFCSECATYHFAQTRPICPVCRRPQTFEQLIRLFPEYGSTSDDAPNVPDIPMPQPHAPQMPQPQLIPHPYPAPDPASPQPTSRSQPPPPSQSHAPTPPRTRDVSSLRISLATGSSFPWLRAGFAPTSDQDRSPVFLGVAAFRNGMHPCKIRPNSSPMALVSYGGKEYLHAGTAYVLPFDRTTMEWVPASDGRVPRGRTPVEGGYELVGRQPLYHALALVQGVKVPGKTGAHINGANVPFGNLEHQVRNYEIL